MYPQARSLHSGQKIVMSYSTQEMHVT